MDPVLALFLSVLTLVALMFLGVHIGFALAIVGFLGTGMLVGFGTAVTYLKTTPFSTVYNYNFTILPLFILMGSFILYSGLASTMYSSVHTLFTWLPGNLSISTTVACALFGSVSGSSAATTAIFTKLGLGDMLRRGYSKPLATGCILGAGGLAALIPPSALLVLYAMLAGQSFGKTQMAGLLPGVLSTFVLSGIILLWVRLRPSVAPFSHVTVSLKERLTAVRRLWPIFLLALVIWGGIFAGVFTPNEAATIGAFIALIMLIMYKGRQATKLALQALLDTVLTSGMIFLIIIGAIFFSHFLTLSRVPVDLAVFLGSLELNRIVIFGLIVLLYFVLGLFLEAVGMLAITLPIVLPILKVLGFDLVWFGVIAVLLCEVGFMTPPVGLHVFVLKGVAGDMVELSDIFKGAFPFWLGYIVIIVILTAFPSIALFIPSHM